MPGALRIGLLDDGTIKDRPFRKPFESLDIVRVVEVYSDVDPLLAAIFDGYVEVVAVNLDGRDALAAVEKIAKTAGDCPVLGVSSNHEASFIIGAMRAGCAQFVCWPVDTDDLRNALQRIRPARLRSPVTSKRICVVGSSGGAGATTVACNVAMELAQLTGRRTALVDMNLEFGDVCCAFDCTPKYSIADVCATGMQVDLDSLNSSLHELPCNVSILARPELVEDAREVAPENVDMMFRLLADTMPYVVVDLPRAYSFLSAAALGRSDSVLIITQLGVPHIRNASRIYQSLVQMGADEERIQIVLNRYNADFERLTTKDVEQHFRRPVFAVIPNDYRFVSASLDLGHPIGADSPDSRARAAIHEMAKKLAPEHAQSGDPRDSGGKLLSRLWGRRSKA